MTGVDFDDWWRLFSRWCRRPIRRRAIMASLKRTDSKTLKETPPRSCVACTETEDNTKLLRPCRTCSSDYCVECLIDMFTAATTDRARMPPHCCSLIQIHTVLGQLTFQQAKEYRAKFEEWITPVKTYCPAPTCSTFISERRVPAKVEDSDACSLHSILGDIVSNVLKNPSARFFRGEMDMTLLPEYTTVVKRPIDLNTIQGHVGQYKTLNDLTNDMQLIVSNAKQYNKEGHPVSDAANELFSNYIEEISNATGRLLSLKASQTLFACPECE